MYPGKELERFLAEVFSKIPAVVEVEKNGYGWGSDFGADLIVKTSTSLGHLILEKSTIIVQVKSYEGPHLKLDAVDQVKKGIETYKGTAGMIITTGVKTKQLENKVQEVSDELGMEIALLDAPDVARFIIKHAPEMLFKLDF